MATTTYATVAEAKARLDITSSDTADDDRLETMIEAISRVIDNICGRRFYTTDDDETRYYTPTMRDIFFCPDDITSITTLSTDADGDRTYENDWTTDDYDLMPANASLNGTPYTWIQTTPYGDYAFSAVSKSLKIVGKFGYSTTAPTAITEACLLMTEKLFRRKDLVFGVAGATSLGEVVTEIRRAALSDAELKPLLDPYIRRV